MLAHFELLLAIILLVAVLVLLWRERREVKRLNGELLKKDYVIEDQAEGLKYWKRKARQ